MFQRGLSLPNATRSPETEEVASPGPDVQSDDPILAKPAPKSHSMPRDLRLHDKRRLLRCVQISTHKILNYYTNYLQHYPQEQGRRQESPMHYGPGWWFFRSPLCYHLQESFFYVSLPAFCRLLHNSIRFSIVAQGAEIWPI